MTVSNKTAEFSLDDIQFNQLQMWVNYVAGTLQLLQQHYPVITGADLVVSGNVPQGAGLSSSASFEIALLKTFTDLYQLPLDGIKAALLGQKAENDFVGCNCGIMDQLISALGAQGHAMLLDCRQLTFKDAPIPDDLALFIVNSKIKRGLVDSEYNKRREQCEQVARHFNQTALRDVSLPMLETQRSQLGELLYKRARHVITENTRTQATLEALKNSDLGSISQLMHDSHKSLSRDFEVSTPQIDKLVNIIAGFVGDQGGARMTGGGFGGCVVALVTYALVEPLTQLIESEYLALCGISPEIYICQATRGAFRDVE